MGDSLNQGFVCNHVFVFSFFVNSCTNKFYCGYKSVFVVQITTPEPASVTFAAASRIQKRNHFEKSAILKRVVVAITAQGSNHHVYRGIVSKSGELTKMYNDAMNELKALKESANPSQVSSSQPVTASGANQKLIVVLPRDKKIKNFTDKKTEGDQPVEDFTEELKTTFEAREMTPAEKVDFIMSHLEGPAKEKVRMYSQKERSNPNFLLEVIRQAFGEK